MKKLTAFFLALALIFTLPAGAFALSKEGGIEPLKALFIQGEGPEVNGYTVDYSYYSPVKENDTAKYPSAMGIPSRIPRTNHSLLSRTVLTPFDKIQYLF